ncbi:uncharacterized protein [Anabrus simplex]|uniref:uncharacterized protein n=1 Tax=Anabrus simplex TaxID=316456 RepID=UPI0035A396F1
MNTRTWVLVALLAASAVSGRPSEDDSSRTRRAQNGGYQAEHRSDPESLKYYGGAKGSVLNYEPGVGYVPKWGTVRKDEKPDEEEEGGQEGGDGGGGGQNDGVSIQLPPAGASVAEARPVGLSIAGVGGVAASKPQATAVVGPAGLAIARPVATAIAGVPVGELSIGPGGGQQQQQHSSPMAVAVGPSRQTGSKYSVLPANTVLLYPQYYY